MPRIESPGGVRIHFEGAGHGPAVLLLHPRGGTCQSWIDLGWFEALAAAGLRAIAIDARGHGESEPGRDLLEEPPECSSQDALAVLDFLGVETAHVCGFSLGAASALRLAVDAPQRVRSLALGGLSLGPLVHSGLWLGASECEARAIARADAEQRIASTTGAKRAFFVVVHERAARIALRPLEGAKLGAPILGIAGDADPYDPAALYAQLARTGADVQIRILPGAGHGNCFPDPRWRELCVAFLAAQPRA